MIHKVFIYFDEKYMQVAKLTYLLPISFYYEHYFTLELFLNQNDKPLINSNETRKLQLCRIILLKEYTYNIFDYTSLLFIMKIPLF